MSRYIFPATVLLLSLISIQSSAQERFIRVTASGTIQSKPDVATMTAYVVGKGDTLEKATEDYQTKLTKATEAFDPMEYRDVKVNIGEATFSIGGGGGLAAMMGGMAGGGGDAPSPFSVSCAFKIEIPLNQEMTQEKINSTVNHVAVGIEKAKLQWSRSEMPQSNSIALSLSESNSALDSAMKKAVDEARRKATVMAELAGKKLGEVISIEETTPLVESTNDSSQYAQLMSVYSAMLGGGGGSGSGDEGLIEVTSHLEVTFAIED